MAFFHVECGTCGHLARHHSHGGPCSLCKTCKELIVPISAREFEVVKAMCAGGVKGAATALGLQSNTIEAHRYNVMGKLRAHTFVEAVLMLLRSGALKLSDLPDAGVRVCVRDRAGLIVAGDFSHMDGAITEGN